MKHTIQRIGMLLALAAAFINAVAYDFEVDGIYYNILGDKTSVEVTYKESNDYGAVGSDYSGNVQIPEQLQYDKKTYRVTEIGDSAFYRCENLTSVTIPNSVTSIGESAFRECSGLTSIEIPNSVTSIGESAFGDCESLMSMEIPNSVTIIEYGTFRGCSSLTSLTIPNSIKVIGDCAFTECTSLTSVTIPNSVLFIDDSAFEECSGLTSVSIGSSVEKIGEYSFLCENLQQIECYAETPPVCVLDAFCDMDKRKCKLYVPKGCKEKYANAYEWMRFLNIFDTLESDSGVESVTDGSDLSGMQVDVYTLEGQMVKKSVMTESLQDELDKGIYVVRTADGKTRKINVK